MKRKARRDEIDVMRTVLWYHHIRAYLGLSSAYQVEMAIEQRLFGDRGRLKNRWSKYENGAHVPKPDLVDSVERIAPGSRLALHHPLWAALRPSPFSASRNEALLRQLSPTIQGIVFSRKAISPTHARTTPGLVRRLQRIGNQDALACLLLLADEAHDVGDTDTLMSIGHSAYIILAMLFCVNAFKSVQAELFSKVQVRLYLLTKDYAKCIRLIDDEFYALVQLVQECIALRETEVRTELSEPERIHFIQQMVEMSRLEMETYQLFWPPTFIQNQQ